jgi:hypothetical protein
MTNKELNEKIDKILVDYPEDSAMDREKTALIALKDGEFLATLGWTQEEVEEVTEAIKERL